MSGRARAASALAVVLCIVLLVAIGAIGLAVLAQGNTRQTALQHAESEVRFAAYAAVAHFGNRFKLDSWPRRYWRNPNAPAGQPCPEVQVTGIDAYRGKAVAVWVRDSVRNGLLVPRTVDVFARAEGRGLVLGLYQRLELLEPYRLDPSAIVLLREICVREDLATPAARDRLLQRAIADEQAEVAALGRADVCQREVAALGAGSPDAALAAAAAAASSGEGPRETDFQAKLSELKILVEQGDLARAVALADALVAAADGSPAVQRVQRAIAGRLMLARAWYVRGAVSADPDRRTYMDRAASALSQILGSAGACARPHAAIMEADSIAVRRAASTRAAREQLRRDLENRLRGLLGGSPAGATFGNGPIPLSELPEAVAAAHLGMAAFRERFIGPSVAAPEWRHQQVSVVDDDGTFDSYQNVYFAGTPVPIDWLPGWTFLLVGDLDLTPFESPLIVNRVGQVIRRFPGLHPDPSNEWVGVHVTPRGNQLVFQGRWDRTHSTAYRVLDMDMVDPAPRVVAQAGDTGSRRNRAVVFSPDGRFAALIDGTRGLAAVDAALLVAGAYASTPPAPLLWDVTAQPVVTLRMTWVMAAGRPHLVYWADAKNAASPPRARVHVYDAEARATVAVWPAFPPGFAPQRCALRGGGPPHALVLLDGDGTASATAPFPAGPAGWTGAAAPVAFPQPMYQNADEDDVANKDTGVAWSQEGRFFFGGPDDTGLWTLDTASAPPALRKLDTPVAPAATTQVGRPAR